MKNQKPINQITDLQELERLHRKEKYNLTVAKSLQNGQKAVDEITLRIKSIKKRKIDLK
ncbi:hypothetical protein ACE193_15440 [Bernardetia sp. OM2101]|uniref:hypothetical protein n=1 Tax=Bernardetia sp. OM2101 TaxID=3344876 RepID=UPI0035D1194D